MADPLQQGERSANNPAANSKTTSRFTIGPMNRNRSWETSVIWRRRCWTTWISAIVIRAVCMAG
jgi:hypothetical protein